MTRRNYRPSGKTRNLPEAPRRMYRHYIMAVLTIVGAVCFFGDYVEVRKRAVWASRTLAEIILQAQPDIESGVQVK